MWDVPSRLLQRSLGGLVDADVGPATGKQGRDAAFRSRRYEGVSISVCAALCNKGTRQKRMRRLSRCSLRKSQPLWRGAV